MNNNKFEYNNIIIIPDESRPYIYYFSDDELDWYETIDLEDTDSFLEFTNAINEEYDSLTYDKIDEYFTNIFESEL